MPIKEIYKIYYTVVDRGAQFAAKPIETNDPDHKRAVKKHLNKYRYAMDLSTKYRFHIDTVKVVGYGTV